MTCGRRFRIREGAVIGRWGMRVPSAKTADLPATPHPWRQRRKPALSSCVLLCALTSASPLFAQDSTLQLDPAQTEINFTLRATFHTVQGTFKLKSGTVRFNPVTGAASGTIVVDTASGNSGNGSRDRNMQEKVLESRHYPKIVFTVDRFEGRVAPEGQSNVQVHGAFSLHGSQHEMTAEVLLQVAGDQATVATHFTIPYVSWGLKNPSTLFLRVSDKVDVDIHAVGHLTSAGTQPQAGSMPQIRTASKPVPSSPG
jgi:polyisoprenoid-binding protein YceI